MVVDWALDWNIWACSYEALTVWRSGFYNVNSKFWKNGKIRIANQRSKYMIVQSSLFVDVYRISLTLRGNKSKPSKFGKTSWWVPRQYPYYKHSLDFSECSKSELRIEVQGFSIESSFTNVICFDCYPFWKSQSSFYGEKRVWFLTWIQLFNFPGNFSQFGFWRSQKKESRS